MRDLQGTIDEEYRKSPEEAMRLYDGKTIKEAFPQVLKSQLESRLNQLEAGRQVMLHQRSRYIANIQKGTYLMWKEGLDQLEQFVALSLDWGTKLINEFNTNGDPERKYLFPALIRNHSRACLMSEGILYLLKGAFLMPHSPAGDLSTRSRSPPHSSDFVGQPARRPTWITRLSKS
jgi:hypothetical protein